MADAARTRKKDKSLMVRVDAPSKTIIGRAARLRGVSASDYVRLVVVAEARRDLDEARTRTIRLSPPDQLAFWQALQRPTALSPRQRALGRLMRGGR
jgi:uncharacterized protein (DUF1778 family)